MVLCRKLGLEPIFGPGSGKDGGADVGRRYLGPITF
jgi:hypothetical protein